MDTVTLNIGGSIFTTYTATLQAFPDSRLAKLTQTSPEYNKQKEWYFFDRNSKMFDAILDLYRTGELHVSSSVCGAILRHELEFWEISLSRVADCCYGTVCSYEDKVKHMHTLQVSYDEQDVHFTDMEIRSSKLNRYRHVIWNFIQSPRSSIPATIFAVVYFLLVVMTVVLFALSTHPAFRNERTFEPVFYEYENETIELDVMDWIKEEFPNPKYAMYLSTTQKPAMYYIDRICALFFGLELLLTVVCCPSKKTLLKNMNFYLDVYLIIVNIITFAIEMHPKVLESESTFWFYAVCKASAILRLFRLMRLTRHVGGLKVMSLAVRASLKELGLILLSFFIAALMFSGFMYYAEFNEPNSFMNVPISIWWSIVTMTTVGYGDYTPSSCLGYMLASICAISGILLLAMPIAIIATAFSEYYSLNNIRQKKNEFASDGSLTTPWQKDCSRNISKIFSNKVIDVSPIRCISVTKQDEEIPNKSR